jgi:hypothetical protein
MIYTYIDNTSFLTHSVMRSLGEYGDLTIDFEI